MKKLILGVVFFAMSLQVGGGALYAAADQKGQVGDTSSYFDQFVQAVGNRAKATKKELSFLWGYLLKKYIHGEKTTQKEDERAKRIQKKLGIAIGALVAIVAIIMGIKWYKNKKAIPLQTQTSAPTQLPVQTGKATNMPEEKDPVDLEEVDPNINKQDWLGNTLLHYAVESGNFEAISSLLKKGADINMRGYRGHTPLHTANRNLEIVKLLVENGADLNALDNFDGTPLHEAALNGSLEVVDFLLKKGAVVNFPIDDMTPLHAAVFKQDINKINRLLEAGAFVNIKNKINQTPLDLARNKKDELMNYKKDNNTLEKSEKIIKLLEEYQLKQ